MINQAQMVSASERGRRQRFRFSRSRAAMSQTAPATATVSTVLRGFFQDFAASLSPKVKQPGIIRQKGTAKRASASTQLP